MAKKPQRSNQAGAGSLIDRARSRITGQPAAPQARKRVPRYEVQARRERLLRRSMAILVIAVVVILGGAYVWSNLILPRQVVASVNGVDITRDDYWKGRAIDLWNQGAQFQQFASLTDPSMAPQYQEMARQAVSQIPAVWGSSQVDNGTLSQMIDDQVYLQNLEREGLAFAPGEVETFMLNQFADPTAPLLTPTPSPTLTPDRAATATATAAAMMGSPAATPLASPLATPSVDGAASGTGEATPIGLPAGSPVATPLASPVPVSADEARRIAEANFSQLSAGDQSFFTVAKLTRADYERLAAAPALARQKVAAKITADVGQSAEQVRARHILVETKDLADQLAGELAAGADFATVARENSVDVDTAPNGGDLGWFAREELPALADTAFGLAPDAISPPVETEFGWHIVQSLEHDAERALSDAQITRIGQVRGDEWLAARRAEVAISASIASSPTPPAGEFAAPLGAPPLPTPTPLPAASPVASPGASPMAPHDMGQMASPAALGTPASTP